MALVDIGDIRLNVLAWGEGTTTVVCIHGNLASASWFALVPPLLPARFRVVAIDWRGCGDSDKPAAEPDFSNYAITRHAADMLAVLHALGIEHCHLVTHSTGGLIALYMLLAEPGRFGKVLALDPVGPRGLRFGAEGRALIGTMRTSRDRTRKGLALTAASLFVPASLEAGRAPEFAPHATEAQRALFERLVDQSRMAADGIWSGIPIHLDDVRDHDGLIDRVGAIRHPHRVLWGTLDPFIPRRDMDEMAAALPDCRLEVVAGVGHSMNIERPALLAHHVADFF